MTDSDWRREPGKASPTTPPQRGPSLPGIVAVIVAALAVAVAGLLLLLALNVLLGGYAPISSIQLGSNLLNLGVVVVGLGGLVAIGGLLVARTLRQTLARTTSIRTRLTLSHLVAVTASTFVYATGGFLLLVAVLYLSGYTLRGMVQLIPQFFGVTVFVLIQIALITLCGIVVARVVSQIVSRRMLQQIVELEEGSNAIASGQLNRHVAVLTNDELGRLAERFNHLTSRLGAADNQRRAFVANISHDLRTPIAVIRGHLDAQRDADGSDDIPAPVSFAAIEHETATLARLIEDLFTLSRLEEGVLPVAAIPVDLAGIVNDTVAGVRTYALKTGRVSVNAQVDEGLPQVMGDATRITQVINNLLHNAVRHTPEGGLVLVEARAVEDGAWVEISVRDTGVGIAPELLGKIFDRYYRGEAVGEKGGAGIGLSIVKQLVEMQGGSVWADSVVGEGTAVTFRLPVGST